jgi:hypothetical protein
MHVAIEAKVAFDLQLSWVLDFAQYRYRIWGRKSAEVRQILKPI